MFEGCGNGCFGGDKCTFISEMNFLLRSMEDFQRSISLYFLFIGKFWGACFENFCCSLPTFNLSRWKSGYFVREILRFLEVMEVFETFVGKGNLLCFWLVCNLLEDVFSNTEIFTTVSTIILDILG